MKTARFIGQLPDTALGAIQELWQVSPPVRSWNYLGMPTEADYLVVSAVDPSGWLPGESPEVVIFPSDSEGTILDMGGVGSFSGTVDHQQALLDSGYTVLLG